MRQPKQAKPKTSKKTISAIKRYRTARVAHIAAKSVYYYRKRQEEKMYTFMCDEMVKLGGVYIKFLQGVLLRSTIMRKWHNPNRLDIFEDLTSEPINIGYFLQQQLPKEKLGQLAMVHPQPFAAGSFGQVYYAQHRDGTTVVIKVLRPLIAETLRYDLRLLRTLSKTLMPKLFPNIQVEAKQAFRDFIDATLRETDYIAETEFANEQYETYKDHPDLFIPKTYTDLCTKHMIVQEFVPGLSLAQVVRMKQQGVDPVTYVYEQTGSDLIKQLQVFGIELFWGIFSKPRIQGDPHPGNIRLLPDNKVGMIDFGIYARPTEQKAAYYGLLQEMQKMDEGNLDIPAMFGQFMRFFATDLYRALAKLSGYTAGGQSDLTHEVGKMIDRNFSMFGGEGSLESAIKDGRILQHINKTANKDNRFGIIMKIESADTLRTAQTFDGILTNLNIRPQVVTEVLRQVNKRVNDEMPWLATEQEPGMSVGHAIETVANWLERVADRDPALFKELTGKMGSDKIKPLSQVAQPADAAATGTEGTTV